MLIPNSLGSNFGAKLTPTAQRANRLGESTDRAPTLCHGRVLDTVEGRAGLDGKAW